MPTLGELLAERRKSREAGAVKSSLDEIQGTLNGSQMMMFVDKQFVEAIAQEVADNNELIDATIEELRKGDEQREAVMESLKDKIRGGFDELGAQIKDKDVRGQVMALSKNIAQMVTVLEESNSKTHALLEQSLKQAPEQMAQMKTMCGVMAQQSDVLAEILLTLRTPKTLVMDDDGNPVGVRHEY